MARFKAVATPSSDSVSESSIEQPLSPFKRRRLTRQSLRSRTLDKQPIANKTRRRRLKEEESNPTLSSSAWLQELIASPIVRLAIGILKYVLEIFILVLQICKPIVAGGVAIWLIFTILSVLISYILSPFKLGALAAPRLCGLPVLSSLPFCKSGALDPDKAIATRPRIINEYLDAQASLPNVIDIASDVENIPLQIRIVEISVTHLQNAIRFQSDLPSRDQIVGKLEAYLARSNTAVDGLIDFTTMLWSVQSSVSAAHVGTKRMLERAVRERSIGGGSGLGMVQNALMATLPAAFKPRAISDNEIISRFRDEAERTENQIVQLIEAGIIEQSNLLEMDNSLNSVSALVAQDKGTMLNEYQNLMEQMWTILGLKNAEKKRMESNLAFANTMEDVWRQWKIRNGEILIELKRILSQVKDVRRKATVPHAWDDGREMRVRELREHIERIDVSLDALETRWGGRVARLDERRADRKRGVDRVLPAGLPRLSAPDTGGSG